MQSFSGKSSSGLLKDIEHSAQPRRVRCPRQKGNVMDTRMHDKIREWAKDIERNYGRVLIMDCYEGYEYRKLKAALEGLLAEVEKK